MHISTSPRPRAFNRSRRASVGLVVSSRHYREALIAALNRDRCLSILDLGAGGAGSLTRLLEIRPDLLLVDLPTSALGAFICDARRGFSALQTIAINSGADEVELIPLFEAGMTAYVARDGSLDEILGAVRSVLCGEFQFQPRIVGALVRRLNERGSDDRKRWHPNTHLTPREEQVLGLLAERLTNKEIAQRLGVEVGTIKNHVHSILHKFSTHRRGDAVTNAARTESGFRVLTMKPGTRRPSEGT